MKILIISHNPISTYNQMGKTFASLFSEFDKDQLCQLYIYPSYPNIDMCSSYYRVTDKDVLSQFLKFRLPGKEVPSEAVNESSGRYENAEDEQLYRNVKNKAPMRRMLRDLMWSMSFWYNKKLKAWLEREQPTHIFVSPGAGKLLHNIALKISKKYSLPIVTYVCDEYYFVGKGKGLLKKLEVFLLKKKYDQLMKHTSHVVAISEELCNDYSYHFAIPSSTVMTGSELSRVMHVNVCEQPTVISYFGNIRCNRYHSLAEVGRTLDKMRKQTGIPYKLKIYTAEKDEKILSEFTGIESVEKCGFISGEEFKQTLSSSELLLHVEAFDESSVEFVKHSVSTKIADSLASGIPLIAYGPEPISSMQHLIRNRCAIFAGSSEGLEMALKSMFSNRALRQSCSDAALKTAKIYHTASVNSNRLKEIMATV